MGAVRPRVSVVPLKDVPAIELPNDSWSRMIINDTSVPKTKSSLGYSVFRPGTVTSVVAHEVEEVAIVLQGHGELRLEDEGAVAYGPLDALHIPARTWHSVAATGSEEVIMVFCFPYPDYPPTERS